MLGIAFRFLENAGRLGTFYGPTSILYSKSFEGPWETLDAGFGSKIPGCPKCGELQGLSLPTLFVPDPSLHNLGGNGLVNRMCVVGDTNPAPLFKSDGSVEMMWRTTEMVPQPTACPADSCMALATASSWRGPYHWSRANIFANQSAATHTHIEDAHMWLAPNGSTNPGSYHAIFHSDVRSATQYLKWCIAPGSTN